MCFLLLAACATGNAGERINQEGRILGPAPTVTTPVLFNTLAADTIISAMLVYPVTSAWNEDISKLPLLSNSAAMITKITNDLASSRRILRMFAEMNYILVPDSEPKQDVFFFNYPDESDDLKLGSTTTGSYPIDVNMPIETWPAGTGAFTLAQWQQDINNDGGDRHSISVMPGAGFVWETWLTQAFPGQTPPWQALNGAKCDLNSNTLRPDGYTSKGYTPEQESVATQDYYDYGSGKTPRYYQLIAINRTVDAIARGENRILLVMATGTGKTYTAFQIIWRLWKSGAKKRILFLVDRNILADQTKTNDFKPFGQHLSGRSVRLNVKAYLGGGARGSWRIDLFGLPVGSANQRCLTLEQPVVDSE